MFDPKDYDPNEAGASQGSASTTPKVLEPGTHLARIVDVYLDQPPFAPKDYNIVVMIETPAIQEEGWQGLPIDSKNPSMGYFDGQVARVKSGRFTFSDFTTPRGEFVERDKQMQTWINRLADAMGVMKDVQTKGRPCETIEEYVEMVAEFLIQPNLWGYFTVAGEEYTNKNGYPAWRLYFPKGSGNNHPFARMEEENVLPPTLVAFDEKKHLSVSRKASGKDNSQANDKVDGFGGQDDLPAGPPQARAGQLDL